MRTTCLLFAALALPACANAPPNTPAALPDASGGRSLAADAVRAGVLAGPSAPSVATREEVVLESEAAPASSPVFGFSASATAGNTSSAATLPSPADASTERGEMIDIEARFAVRCDAVDACAAKFRELVAANGGRVTVDDVGRDKRTEVTFEARVPADRFDRFAHGVTGLGDLQARDVRRRDVSKDYHDSALLLHEREVARKRYEDLLAQAKTVEETLKVEQQLERLRTEIDRIQGDLRWLKDRVASATVRVRIVPSAASEDAVFAPSATLYPTLRASLMFDLRSETQRIGYVGGGFSVQFRPFGRALTFDVDLARATVADKPTVSDWSYTFLAGFDLYSDLLGGGRRKFLNPYLGFRLGYAINEGAGDFAFGGVVGVDLVKTKAVLLDVGARVLGLVGNAQGPHVQVGPAVQFSVAF